jgi:hypothetical protein
MKLKDAKMYRAAIEAGANAVERSDLDALAVKDIYPAWKNLIGQTVNVDFKLTYDGKLYKVIQAHTVQADWIPGVGTESLYAVIDEGHTGAEDDPIPYDGNMELFEGLYYVQNGVTYRCTRNSGQPVYHALSDLVGLYVEVV